MENTLTMELRSVLATKGPDISAEFKRLILKEYIHSYVLSFIYGNAKYSKLVFYGGTCLRYVYGLDRLSEDLDFNINQPCDFGDFEADLKRYFKEKAGYKDAEVKNQFGERDIYRFTLKLPILHDVGLSTIKGERLFVKVEISDHKSHGEMEKKALSLYGKNIILQHYDLPTLFSGKILACLERDFKKGGGDIKIKGRDFYDLIWFMHKGVIPNQTKLLKDGKNSYTLSQAFEALSVKIQTLQTKHIYADIINLLENPTYAEKWTENFKDMYFSLVKNYV